MQLLLTLDELQALGDVLEECTEQPSTDPNRMRELEELLDKLIARKLQFSSDELDLLSDVAGECGRELRARIAVTQDQMLKQSLEHRRDRLQRAADKITEACAMA